MGGLGEDAFSLSSLSSSSPSSSSPLRAVIPYAVESLYRSVPRRPAVPRDRHRRRRRRGSSAPQEAKNKHVNGKQRRRRKIFTGARDFLFFGVGCVGGSDVIVDGEPYDTREDKKREPLGASGATLGVPVPDQEQKERREHRSKRRRRRRWWGRTR
ncbi:hypothetical protein PUN28_019795 [Cardiocondyla obscurior]|uniref:Uncharacterized protein n=1 Tax=Cardiocondyla obscurior TaxID=286306 RepID=A0AAW2E7E7_9HYME